MSQTKQTQTISLKQLICDIGRWHNEEVNSIVRSAATLALQCQHDLTQDQRRRLKAIEAAERPSDLLEKGKAVERILDRCEGEAMAQVSRQIGRALYARQIWEVAIEKTVVAARRAEPRFYCNSSSREFVFARHCAFLLGLDPDSDPDLIKAVNLLDAEGFAEELLRKLRKECPQEAAYRGLSRTCTTADEAVALLGDEWATVAQSAGVTGKTVDAVRAAINRAKKKLRWQSMDEEQIPEWRPGTAKNRFRIRGVWDYISTGRKKKLTA